MYKNMKRDFVNPQGWPEKNGAVPYILSIIIEDLQDEDLYQEIEFFTNSHTYLWLLEQGSFAPLYMDILNVYNIEKEQDFIIAMLSLYSEDFEDIKEKENIKENWTEFSLLVDTVFNSLILNKLNISDFLGSHTYLWLKEKELSSPSVGVIIDIFKSELENGTFGFIESVLSYYREYYVKSN